MIMDAPAEGAERIRRHVQHAPEKPDRKDQDLVVRVAGYSAYFTSLSRDVQNEVISRNTQNKG